MKRFFLVAVMAIVAVFVVKAEPISKEEIVAMPQRIPSSPYDH